VAEERRACMRFLMHRKDDISKFHIGDHLVVDGFKSSTQERFCIELQRSAPFLNMENAFGCSAELIEYYQFP
jgi:hypothetical protein